jgi:tetratricopeptide (TPR) repeat protein
MTDGGATERPRRARRDRAPTTPDPIEMAMEAEADGAPPSGVAVRVLQKQEQLIGWEIADRRASFALKAAAGVVAAALALGLGFAAWNASQASGTVIEPFDSAPALVAQGLGGEAIASELVSRMTAMQVAAGSDRPRRQSSSGADKINVVIPETGVSIGEAQRLLREWLGHETHVSGALRPTPDGKLAFALRVDGRNVPVAPPPPDQLASADAWILAGAEAAVRETDPYKYATWLSQQGRMDEAAGVYRRLVRAGSPEDQGWAWSGLASVYVNEVDLAAAWEADLSARRLAPTLDTVLTGMTNIQRILGHDEQARFYAQEGLRLGRLRHDVGRHALRVAARSVQAGPWSDDWLATARAFETVVGLQRSGESAGYPPGLVPLYGRALARLHEPQRAMRFTPDLDPLSGSVNFDMRATQLDQAARWAELEALAAQPFHFPPGILLAPQMDRVVRVPWLAYAMARNGKAAEARAILGPTPLDCYFCLRMRGVVAALAGDAAEADRWFAEAVRQGPSLADADYEWAQAKLARGDAAGALVLAREAARKAPVWADPPKLEADLLARRGDLGDAVRLYEAAEQKAPAWGALRLAHGDALARLGRPGPAVSQWRTAAGLELTPAERAGLTQRLAHLAGAAHP